MIDSTYEVPLTTPLLETAAQEPFVPPCVVGEMPLASFCVPLYNKREHLAKTLDALLAQTYPHLEIVISDNASDDGSSNVAQHYALIDSRVLYHRLERTISLNENWRYVYRLAHGDFVNLHSADDHTLQPDFLEKMIAPLLAQPAIGFSVCAVQPCFGHSVPGVDASGLVRCYQTCAELCRALCATTNPWGRLQLLRQHATLENRLGTPAAVVCRREALPWQHWQKSIAYWPEAYADWDYMLRFFLHHRGVWVEDATLNYHYDANSPYWRIQAGNPDTTLIDKMYRLLMPLTILSDPDLSDLRESHSKEEGERMGNCFDVRMREVLNAARQVTEQRQQAAMEKV